MVPLVALVALVIGSPQAGLDDWNLLSSGSPPASIRRCLGHTAKVYEVRLTSTGTLNVEEGPLAASNQHVVLPPSAVSLPRDTQSHSIDVGGGWLVGFDAGEFGGGLWWVDTDGRRGSIALDGVPAWARNVHALMAWPTGALAFVGLAHLSADYGAVFRCFRENGRWTARLVSETDGAPTAAARAPDGGAVFVTGQGVGTVTTSGVVKTVLRSNFADLYPGSIVVDCSGTVFVGMRSVVIRLPRGATQEDWLVPPGCHRVELVGTQCECRP